MNDLNLDDPVSVFCAGYLCCLGTGSGSEPDTEYVLRCLGMRPGERSADYEIQWPREAGDVPLLRLSGQKPGAVAPEMAQVLSQGALSALLQLDSDAGGDPRIRLSDESASCLPFVLGALGLSAPENGGWLGVAALDVVGRILEQAPASLPSLLTAFGDWRVRIAHLTNRAPGEQRIVVRLVHPDARLPMKEHVSDSGYDLTLLYEKKRFGRTILYGTGVTIEPPFGWYFDVVPRSSIIKRGYILANSVGVIDRSYRGEIFVPLMKIDETAEDLELPARVAQLIPRPIVHFPVEEVHALSTTRRGAGGFGSTGQ